jgi:transcriptional regulator
MYIPPHFRENDPARLHDVIRAARLCNLVTSGGDGLMATPLPMLLTPDEGPLGTLYGHIARANPQRGARGEALAIFMGPEASPEWYPSKRETGKVVPTWNYVAVHAYGPLEVFDDPDRLLAVVTGLTDAKEAGRAQPWSVADAPEAFVRAQLRGIVGLRVPITRLEGKRKLSQNQPAANRRGVAAGLDGGDAADRAVARLIPLD